MGLQGAELTVASIAQAGDDIAVIVQAFVEHCDVDIDIGVCLCEL